MALSSNTIINNRYQLESFIASGGFGEVWKATDLRLNRSVAIKMVEQRFLQTEPKALTILRDEAIAGAQLLGNENIVAVLDIIEGDDNGNSAIVMEFIDGIQISQWVSSIAPGLQPRMAFYLNARLGWEFCKAISIAHRSNLLHRDIKPHNALINSRGILKVTDFGLARFIDAVTRTHTMAGAMTAAFAAPEQWTEDKYTEKSDIYQLGCALYQIFTGRLPFECSSMMAFMNAHLKNIPEPPTTINPLIPSKLSAIILQTLEKDPEARPAIWRIHDEISDILYQPTYSLIFKDENPSEELREKIYDITSIDSDKLIEGGEWTFPDPNEVLNEAIALAMINASFNLNINSKEVIPHADSVHQDNPVKSKV